MSDENLSPGGAGPDLGPAPDFWLSLFPKAMDLLGRALRDPSPNSRRLGWMAPALARAYPADGSSAGISLELQGALGSAASEFFRWLDASGLTDAPSEEELAFHLIRITYNRWQRRDRQDRQLRRATELGARSVDIRGSALLGSIQARDLAEAEIFARQIVEVIDEIFGGLSDRDREILRLALDRAPDSRIARELNCHRTTVARVIRRFRDRVSGMLSIEPSGLPGDKTAVQG